MLTGIPKTCAHVYIHFVWATWDREPFITPDSEPGLHSCIADECRSLKCEPLAVNGMSDHVHVLVRMHTAVSMAELVKQMKGSSSHLMTHVLTPEEPFKWQGSYGAFSVSRNHISRVVHYIARQKQQHTVGNIWNDWEVCGAFDD